MVHNFLPKEIENNDKGTVWIGLLIPERLKFLPLPHLCGNKGRRATLQDNFYAVKQAGQAMESAGSGQMEQHHLSSKALQRKPKSGFLFLTCIVAYMGV